ncbi:MAG: glycosyltransferase [Phenylobacterium sp.]
MTTAKPPPAALDEGLEITMLICTRNRAAQLRKVLESVTRLRVPGGLKWELLVVDNGSSDDTVEVVRSFTSRLPVHLTREETPGLSNARNRGVAEARGRYICWTDDDVIVDEGWLAAYVAAFKAHPDAAVFGGRITPVLDAPTPDWFGRLVDEWPLTSVLAKREWGPVPIPLDVDRGIVPWGANFAIRTREQRQVPYDPNLGVSPLQKRVGEEAEVIFQILSQGGTGWWTPDAQVQHIIPLRRQTLAHVFEISAANGETVSYLESLKTSPHHKSANRKEIQRTKGGPAWLNFMSALNRLLFGVLWLLGAKRRSLLFQVRAGFYAGAANFAAGQQRLLSRAPRAQGDPGKVLIGNR